MNQIDKNLIILTYAEGKESELIASYIDKGPTELQHELGLDDRQWQVVFNYLIFQHNLLFKCVVANTEFFTQDYIKYGASHIRQVLDVTDELYDKMWQLAFDLIAISHEALLSHVVEHRDRYMEALWEHGSDFVRKVLGIFEDRYEDHWVKVLDFLLHSTCDDMFSSRNYDYSLKAFSQIYNGTRVHRRITPSGILI